WGPPGRCRRGGVGGALPQRLAKAGRHGLTYGIPMPPRPSPRRSHPRRPVGPMTREYPTGVRGSMHIYPHGVSRRRAETPMTTTDYQVTGMTCGHCERSVREEVGGIEGVRDIQVSAADGTLVVTTAQPVDDAAVIAAVAEA